MGVLCGRRRFRRRKEAVNIKPQVFEVIHEIIARANELNAIVKSESVSPIQSGRAAWERKGILDALKIICEKTKLFNFLDLQEHN